GRDEHAGVVAVLDAPYDGEFGVAKGEGNVQAACFVEKHLRGGTGHLPFKPGIQFRFVFDPPVGEKRGERAFGEDDEVTVAGPRLAHLVHEPTNRLGPRRLSRDGAALGRSNRKKPWHGSYSVGRLQRLTLPRGNRRSNPIASRDGCAEK